MSVEGVPIAASTIKLDAVNEMLAAIGEYPVAALDTGGDSLAALAEDLLDRVDETIQEQGHYENTESDIELEPDDDDYIQVDADVLRIDTWGPSAWKNVDVRNDRLYDLDEQTDEFDDNLFVQIIRQKAFDDLTVGLRNQIVKEAKRLFQREQVGSHENDRFLEEEHAHAIRRGAKSDQGNGDYSILRGPHADRIIGRRTASYPGR